VDGDTRPRAALRTQSIDLPEFRDARGTLLPIEFAALPIEPRRLFVVSGVTPGTTRGGHTHRTGNQVLVAISGAIDVEIDDGSGGDIVRLDRPHRALLIPAGVWSSQTYLTVGALLLVISDRDYDEGDLVAARPSDLAPGQS
jgi:dTDP-4-dehydrorhamnose 3,5-epimerase-like enzyme